VAAPELRVLTKSQRFLRWPCHIRSVFYARYVLRELSRRRVRTLLTVAGLGLGVALVITISGLSRGLDRAQKTALNPLSGIGTDLTVTRGVQTDTTGFGGPGGSARDLIQSNQSVLTDLSKLGKPGQHFVHDFFLPGTQLTFPTSQGASVSRLSGVAASAQGLLLIAEHQEGVVPKIVARFQTGGQTFRIRRNISPLTPAEQQALQKCLEKNGATFGQAPPQGQGQPQGQNGFGGGGTGNGQGRRGFFRGAFQKCLPARLRTFIGTFRTPQQTLQQVLDPPQTNIKTTPYTIGGVDQTQTDIGLITPKQVTKGRYFSAAGGREALVATSYAARQKLKVGSSLHLNGTTFTVVGLVSPPLGGQTADVYLPLKQLQTLAHQPGVANVVFVRADKSSSVKAVKNEITQRLQGAQVATAQDVADRVTGSLVDAANLTHNLGLLLEVIVAAAAFLMAALLTLSSVGKRVRELGTLKAIGWTQRLVVRQVVGESVAQGVLGGAVGIVLGVVAALVIGAFGPTLTATSTTGSSGNLLGSAAVRTAHETLSLHAPLSVLIVVLGLLLALAGGLLAGAAGGLRAARLRPAEAMRRVE
jgi:putative ABC transport system permease protein